MKYLKKLGSVLLALVMVLALMAPAFAADKPLPSHTAGEGTGSIPGTKGTITVNKAVPGAEYTAYRLLVLESYDTTVDPGAYRYTVATGWENFFTSGAGADYVAIDKGYVEWKTDKMSAADIQAFANAALTYAKGNGQAVGGVTQTATGTVADPSNMNGSVTFSDLPLGYYLVDSAVGTVCSLSSTDNTVVVEDKNDLPGVDKTITGINGEDYQNEVDENSAKIGDVINYKTVVTAQPGGKNYVLHDTMTAGLDFDADSVKITVGGDELNEDYYDVVEKNPDDPDDDGCTFHVTFTQAYLDTISAETKIIVEYSATLTADAVIYPTGTNDNKTHLEFGENLKTKEDETKTYTFRFDVVKTPIDKTNVLDGAKFALYDAEKEGNLIPLVEKDDGSYRVATETEAADDGFVSAVIEAGCARVEGLAEGTYWLEETEAPAGYNKVDDGRIKVEVGKDKGLDATLSKDEATGETTWVKDGIRVENGTGTRLPETGGIGTTIFYIVGGVLVVGAVVLLITKRRTSVDDE